MQKLRDDQYITVDYSLTGPDGNKLPAIHIQVEIKNLGNPDSPEDQYEADGVTYKMFWQKYHTKSGRTIGWVYRSETGSILLLLNNRREEETDDENN